MFIDTHAHLYLADFKNDFANVLEEAKLAGVKKILLPNIDNDSIHASVGLSKTYPDMLFPMIGLHPCSIQADFPSRLEQLQELFPITHFIAIGEIGIDLYWDETYRDEQIRAFTQQVTWADSLHLPVVIHSRASIDLILDILEELNLPDLTGVFHCFTGDSKQAERILYLNFYIGIGGVITFKKSETLRKTVQNIPLNNILLETDAPYLTPHPYRSKRNESKYLPIIADQLSTMYHISSKSIGRITSVNAKKLFSLV